MNVASFEVSGILAEACNGARKHADRRLELARQHLINHHNEIRGICTCARHGAAHRILVRLARSQALARDVPEKMRC